MLTFCVCLVKPNKLLSLNAWCNHSPTVPCRCWQSLLVTGGSILSPTISRLCRLSYSSCNFPYSMHGCPKSSLAVPFLRGLSHSFAGCPNIYCFSDLFTDCSIPHLTIRYLPRALSSFIDGFIPSLNMSRSVTDCLTPSMTVPLLHSLSRSFTGCLIPSLIVLFRRWLSHSFTDCLVPSLSVSFLRWLSHTFTECLTPSLTV